MNEPNDNNNDIDTLRIKTQPLSGRILSGSIGAIITSFAVTPLEVLKVRQQQQQHKSGIHTSRCRDCGTFIMNNGLMDCVVNKRDVPQHFRNENVNIGNIGKQHQYSNKPKSMNMDSMHMSKNSGILRLLRNIYKVEGFGGIYAGLYPTLIMSVPNTVLYFTSYDEIFYRLQNIQKSRDLPEWLVPLIGGGSARLIATFTTSPLELLRTRQAISSNMNSRSHSRGALGEMTEMMRMQGISSLWKGLGPTLWRDVPFSAVYWLGVENIRSFLNNRSNSKCTPDLKQSPFIVAWHSFVGGALSGIMAAFLTAPFDVVKTRIQSQMHDIPAKIAVLECNHSGATALADLTKSSSTLEYMFHIGKTEGTSSLWRGNVTRMAKVAPACAIMISCYELGKTILGET